MKINKNDLVEQAINLIKDSDNILIASHIQPDGDSIGSMLAMGMAIDKLKGNVKMLKVDKIPSDYLFLPNIEKIKDYNDENIDLFIALDCGDIERLGLMKNIALKAEKIINIDHHITNDEFGDINIVCPSSAATGELIYDIIKSMGIQIDRDIAICLYTAISTDTGSFMYSNTTDRTHLIASELIKTGIDIDVINRNIYQSRSLERTNLFLDALNTLDIYLDGKVAIVKVTENMLKSNNANLEDTEGIISFVREIDTIEVACLLKEIKDDEIKISMRSKQYMDVSKVCMNFDGGGHPRAAGCTIYKNIEEAQNLLLEEIKKVFR